MASCSTSHYEHIIKCEYPISFAQSCFYPGCQCQDCSNTHCKCMLMSQPTAGEQLYVKDLLETNKFPSNYIHPIYECNSNCTCDMNCGNRLIQKGSLGCLEVFDTKTKGMGVRTTKPILTGQFVIEFVGEVIKVDEGRKRLKALGENESCYIVLLKEHVGELKTFITCVDATLKGNEARFMNHSCQPNLILIPVRVDSIIPHLCLFSLRDISAGEELTYDYSGGNDSVVTEKGLTPCLCGSLNCRGFLPFQDV